MVENWYCEGRKTKAGVRRKASSISGSKRDLKSDVSRTMSTPPVAGKGGSQKLVARSTNALAVGTANTLAVGTANPLAGGTANPLAVGSTNALATHTKTHPPVTRTSSNAIAMSIGANMGKCTGPMLRVKASFPVLYILPNQHYTPLLNVSSRPALLVSKLFCGSSYLST